MIREAVLSGDLDVMSMTPPWTATLHGAPVILLDTTAGLYGMGSLVDLARGRIGADQMDALAWHIDALSERTGRRPWVLMHHHPTYHTNYVQGDNALIDMKELQRVLKSHPVELVACGHKHHFEPLLIEGARWAVSVPRVAQPRQGGYPAVAVQHTDGVVDSVELLLI